MTILASVFVPDGIVMAADSRVTLTTTYPNGRECKTVERDNEYKISLLRKGTVGISYHGKTHIDKKPVPGLLKEFDDKYINENDTLEEISKKLHEYMSLHPGSEVCFIACGYDKGDPIAYTICEDAYVLNFSNRKPYHAIWRGDIEQVDKRYSNIDINSNPIPLESAIEFAELIIKTAIDYEVIKGHNPCGGPIDVLVLTKGYTKFYKHKNISLIESEC
ncbi:Ntn hydrolase family protein [Oceanobacillus damuensis]|uniref:hypothetical protein n=1 Tax=Oceanobacillus damuensis TaxID=937928 RepID=UPI0008335280|nr:hypothetical protein [Oceanobacillus damuensis]